MIAWPPSAMEATAVRRANLLSILYELQYTDIEDLESHAAYLGLPVRLLQDLLMGGVIPDAIARLIEWSSHKPFRWMDIDHRDDPLP